MLRGEFHRRDKHSPAVFRLQASKRPALVQLTKDVQKQGEEAKIAVRNVRRDAMDKFKAQKKAGELTEDDQKNLEEEVQKLTDKFIKEIDATCARKNQEIMEV